MERYQRLMNGHVVVVNELFHSNGKVKENPLNALGNSAEWPQWLFAQANAIGKKILKKKMHLYLSDYDVEFDGPKVRGLIALLLKVRASFKESGVADDDMPSLGIGIQGQFTGDSNVSTLQEVMALAETNNLETAITELDVRMGTTRGTLGSADGLHARSAADGSEKWFAPIGQVERGPAISPRPDGIIYVTSTVGSKVTLIALNSDGTELRKTPVLGWFMTRAPVVDRKGNVYFSAFATMYSYDENGGYRWAHQAPKPITNIPSLGPADELTFVAATTSQVGDAEHSDVRTVETKEGTLLRSGCCVTPGAVVFDGLGRGLLVSSGPTPVRISAVDKKWVGDTHVAIEGSVGHRNQSSPAMAADGTLYYGWQGGLSAVGAPQVIR
jgi:hypothetical protein